MDASPAAVELLTRYFAAIEAKDLDALEAMWDDHVTLRSGADPAVVGRAAMRARFEGLFASIDSLAHRLVHVWEEDGGTIVSEDVSIWTLPNGKVVENPSCGIFVHTGGRFTDIRIYSDSAPISRGGR